MLFSLKCYVAELERFQYSAAFASRPFFMKMRMRTIHDHVVEAAIFIRRLVGPRLLPPRGEGLDTCEEVTLLVHLPTTRKNYGAMYITALHAST